MRSVYSAEHGHKLLPSITVVDPGRGHNPPPLGA